MSKWTTSPGSIRRVGSSDASQAWWMRSGSMTCSRAKSPSSWFPRSARPTQLLFDLMSELFELRPARHGLHERVAGDLVAGPVAHQPAPVEDDEAVADREGVMRVVGDEDHAEPALARLDDVLQHDAGLLDAVGRR